MLPPRDQPCRGEEEVTGRGGGEERAAVLVFPHRQPSTSQSQRINPPLGGGVLRDWRPRLPPKLLRHPPPPRPPSRPPVQMIPPSHCKMQDFPSGLRRCRVGSPLRHRARPTQNPRRGDGAPAVTAGRRCSGLSPPDGKQNIHQHRRGVQLPDD